jgi:hypothetical protein
VKYYKKDKEVKNMSQFSDWFYGTEGSAIDRVPDFLNKKMDDQGTKINNSASKTATSVKGFFTNVTTEIQKLLKDASIVVIAIVVLFVVYLFNKK